MILQIKVVDKAIKPRLARASTTIISCSFNQSHHLVEYYKSDEAEDVARVTELVWEKVYQKSGKQQIFQGGLRYATTHEVVLHIARDGSFTKSDDRDAELNETSLDETFFPFFNDSALPQWYKDHLRTTVARVPAVSNPYECDKMVVNKYDKGFAFAEHFVSNTFIVQVRSLT